MADTQHTDSPAIILVEPQLGENIGMVARAMANFGLADMRLVTPRDGWPNEKAIATASNAYHVIATTQVFDTVEQAVADRNFVLATTARARDGFKPVMGPVDAGADLQARSRAGQKTGILFGRERYGLENDEIAQADAIVTFPVDAEFASLNIAQAVLLMSYEWMKSGLASPSETAFEGPQFQPAPRRDLQGLLAHLEEALSTRGYFRPDAKKPRMLDGLRAVFTRPAFTEDEIKVLRGIVVSLDYYSPKEPHGAGYPERKKAADQSTDPSAEDQN